MARILLGIGVIFTALFGAVSSFLDRSGIGDWVDRLDSSDTYSVVATTTLPIPLESSKPLLPKEEPRVVIPSGTTSAAISKTLPPTPPSVTTKKVVSPPAPSPKPQSSSPDTTGAISEKAILDLTNVERVREGKSVLSWNEKLAQMAYAKAKDMLDRQYFAHESPEGKNVAGLAEDASYAYRLVGENLAVGNFRTSEELIAGWMGSPGHKENILKSEYTEMGAAAIEGVFEGDRVWMAVQEFGKPFPACDKPSTETKEGINRLNIELAALDEGITSARNAITASEDDDVRTQKIADYNMLVDAYNKIVPTLKLLISAYNDSVRAYNACVGA